MSVTTPINIEQLQYELKDYPDVLFTKYLINELKYGFNTGFKILPEHSIECKNLVSAILQPQCVTSLIDNEVSKEYFCGPFKNIPFKHFCINPIGIAEGKYSKKKRLIVDLSAPHEDETNP